jgi:hypothetical protein
VCPFLFERMCVSWLLFSPQSLPRTAARGCGNKERGCGLGRGICAGVHTVDGLELEKGGRGRHGSGLEEAWSRGKRLRCENAFTGQVMIVVR